MKKISMCMLAAALCGCSSPPTDADAQQAMVRMVTSVAGEQGADMAKDMVKGIRVSACRKAEPQGYTCDVTGGMGGARSMRFIKDDKGWIAIQ